MFILCGTLCFFEQLCAIAVSQRTANLPAAWLWQVGKTLSFTEKYRSYSFISTLIS